MIKQLIMMAELGLLTPDEMQDACNDFNRRYAIGSQIVVWPGAIGEGEPSKVRVIEPGAYVLSGHTPVVQVTGGHGCIALTHVEEAVCSRRSRRERKALR